MKTTSIVREIECVKRAPLVRAPLVISYGMGVDSTAMIVGCVQRGIPIDVILFANVGGEKDETYAYKAVMNDWLRKHGQPEITEVTYRAKNFKHYPPYHTLEQNCLTNGTLPGEAFGMGSCSLKWKADPQEKWLKEWAPAQEAWAAGLKVKHAIGYDCSENDRSTKAVAIDQGGFELCLFLQDWGWDREECIRQIAAAGLPVPPKSSCWFCPNMGKDEVRDLDQKYLRRIVFMEYRAKPRLEGHFTQEQLDAAYVLKLAKWKKQRKNARAIGKVFDKPAPRVKTVGDPGLVKGLWRSGNKGTKDPLAKKPGMMSEFIRAEGLLPAAEVDAIAAEAPLNLMNRAQAFAAGLEIESWDEMFDDLGDGAQQCSAVITSIKPAARIAVLAALKKAA